MVRESLGNLFSVKSGDGIAVSSLNSHGKYPVYGGNGINGYFSKYNVKFGKMIIGRVGEKCGNINITNSESWISDNALIVIPKIHYDINYMSYLLKHINLNAYANRNAQPVISGKIIYAVETAFIEDIQIQKKVSAMIQSFDTYIDNLTELIEKKRNIRDGALEDLVSGRTRLDGFSGEWCTMPLSRFTVINPSTDVPDSFVYVDLESVKGISLIGKRRETKHSAPSRARRFAQKGDVFYQTVRPYQKNNYFFDLDGNYVFSTGYAQLRTSNDPNYLFLLIRQDSFVNCVLDNCTGTSYPAINPKKLSETEIYVPVDKKEQSAIASIIMALDTEIASLEEEKDKMLQIKAGAMDDLLTGRVRLKV